LKKKLENDLMKKGERGEREREIFRSGIEPFPTSSAGIQ